MCPQCFAQGAREDDRPPASAALRLDEDQSLVALTLQCSANGERAGVEVEVEVAPAQTQRLTLPKSKGKGHRPAFRVSSAA